MDVSNYYYKLLNLNNNATKQDVINAYNIKIKKYSGLPFLDVNQESEIKELKKAYAVLTNNELRAIYDDHNFNKQKVVSDEKYSKRAKLDSQFLINRTFEMAGIANPQQKHYDIDRSFFSSNSFDNNYESL
jgi:DnaJ-class molecular chaperone